jgi:hypothetical protein
MAGGRLHVDKDLKNTKSLDPNLRDEGAGFFSTLFTAGSNLGTDALTEIGYIAQAVARPIDTGEAVLRVLAGYAQKALPDDWEKYLPEDWATNKEYANAINEYYAEKYGSLEQAADSFAEQPVSVALDAFAVKALLTTVSKQAAKRSIATTKMADTAKGTVMEGELASRAAAEAKVAQELERTVKYEGNLVWDEALGAYVPESSVVKPKVDAKEVAPIIDDIEAATPSVQPAVANLNTEGMMRATRNQEVSPALTSVATRLSDDAMEMQRYADEAAGRADYSKASNAANEVKYYSDQINRLDSIAANRGALSAAELAEYQRYWDALEENARILDNADADLPFTAPSISNSVNRVTDADGVALNILRSELEFAQQQVNNPVTLDLGGKVTPVATAHNLNIVNNHPAKIAALESQIATKADEAKLVRDNISMTDDAQLAKLTDDLDGIKDEMAKLEAEYSKITLSDDGPAWLVNRGYELEGRLDRKSDGLDSAYKAKVAEIAALEAQIATKADTAKLARDNKRMTDDAAMASATQGELFANVNAAAYETYQASRLANEVKLPVKVADDTALATRGMMATRPETRLAQLARTKDIDMPPPRTTPKPDTETKTVIKPANVLPAAQRIAAAANQNQLIGERDIDGSLIAKSIKEKAVDVKPKSPYTDMPPYEKSIDNREIGKKDEDETRAGWKLPHQFDREPMVQGNYWSADFEDEHWNTPAGVQEAIGIWGRPVGNRIAKNWR